MGATGQEKNLWNILTTEMRKVTAFGGLRWFSRASDARQHGTQTMGVLDSCNVLGMGDLKNTITDTFTSRPTRRLLTQVT